MTIPRARRNCQSGIATTSPIWLDVRAKTHSRAEILHLGNSAVLHVQLKVRNGARTVRKPKYPIKGCVHPVQSQVSLDCAGEPQATSGANGH